MTDGERQARDTCSRKRSRGNVYLSSGRAEQAAVQMSLRTKRNIHAYRCPFGEHWHVGTHLTEEQKRRRRQQQEEERELQRRFEEQWDDGDAG